MEMLNLNTLGQKEEGNKECYRGYTDKVVYERRCEEEEEEEERAAGQSSSTEKHD